MAKALTAEEAAAFVRQIKWMGLGVLLLFLGMALYALHLDGRIQSLKHSPPTELQAEPNARSDLYHLAARPVVGQVVYVPAYSHIYRGANDPYLLTITLSVRNTSVDSEIIVKSIRYFDTQGRELKEHLDKPVRLQALGTTEVVIERDDRSGGSGANFLVEWHAKAPVTEPIVEAVMIATSSQQGVSFVRRGSVISVAEPNPTPAPTPAPQDE